jgi:ArsR family transcriptional regulator, virulence genes transcriptional regulator
MKPINDTTIINMKRNANKAEKMLKLLANANRLMILCHLIKGKKSVGELSYLIDLSSSALSQHLSKMRNLNMVESEKKGQTVYYSINNPEVHALLSMLYLIYCKE